MNRLPLYNSLITSGIAKPPFSKHMLFLLFGVIAINELCPTNENSFTTDD